MTDLAATGSSASSQISNAGKRRLAQLLPSRSARRALITLAAFLIFWQVGATSRAWLGVPLPIIGLIPAPDAVAAAWLHLLWDP